MINADEKAHKFTQTGTLSIIILLPILVFSLVMIFFSLKTGLFEVILFSFLAATFLLCLLIFYKLTIVVDDKHVAFKLGTGIISRKYLVSEIKSCRPVKNSPFAGTGIKMIPNGWLYNVSGSYAVELSFKDRNSVVRIGTDQPEEVAILINRLITNQQNETFTPGRRMSGFYRSAIIVILALLLPAILLIIGGKEQSVELSENEVTIRGIYGMSLNYSGITVLDTVSYLPAIRRRTNGYAAGNTLKGNFTVTNGKKVRLFVRKANPPYIHIECGGQIIYLNFKDRNKTIKLFNALKNKTGQI